jgi:hypothetical protein
VHTNTVANSGTLPAAPKIGLAVRVAAVVFTTTVFVGSTLLFLVQPMFGKLVLPRLGGSPSVWNTCMVFFQAMLLAGYGYAHLSTKALGVRRQSLLHLAILLIPLPFLPIALPSGEPSPEHPIRWQLGSMLASVGLPFFVVSTSAPLLQRWFATLPLPSARDPYFLYAASNAGSLTALLCYPLLLEPLIGVREQTVVWALGYVVLVAATLGCIVLLNRTVHESASQVIEEAEPLPVGGATRAAWILLSFMPSSLMLGVTSYITADLAAVPLLWVLPLALYLITFIIAFAPRRIVPLRPLVVVMQVLVILSLVMIFADSHHLAVVPLSLGTFFVVAVCCHESLARRRPHVSRLTEFYMWMSLGGVLGGAFNSLVAPQLFDTVLEFPLVLAASPLVVWWLAGYREGRMRPEVIAAVAAVVCFATGAMYFVGWPSLSISTVLLAAALGTLSRLAFAPGSPGGAVIAVMLMALVASGAFRDAGSAIFTGRSFFGVHRVVEASDGTHRLLYHGSTIHGRQELRGDACTPSSYYFQDGPAGQVMKMTTGRRKTVAVIGLGAGTLACYADPGEAWTFYEIDPMVDYLATRSGLLTQIANSPGNVSVVLGDGRLKIQAAPPESIDLLVVDTFSSDSIPTHLVTREAIALYVSRLRSDGLLLMNVSNRYIDVGAVVTAIATRANLPIRRRIDTSISAEDAIRGRTASDWVVIARNPVVLAGLDRIAGWAAPQPDSAVRAWTDDYSNLLDALHWR